MMTRVPDFLSQDEVGTPAPAHRRSYLASQSLKSSCSAGAIWERKTRKLELSGVKQASTLLKRGKEEHQR